jgi:hypothetical protein
MLQQSASNLVRIGSVVLIGMVGVLACVDQQTTGPTVTGVELAKGGGGGPGPKVNEVDPPSAPQDTTLDVRVLGSGFDETAVVTFTLDGVPTDSVRTISTTFVSSKEVIANITIATDAVVDLYDAEVFLSGPGKKGIGANLFAVTEKGGKPADPVEMSVVIPTEVRPGVSNMLLGDGLNTGEYVGGQCGVKALLSFLSGDETDFFDFRPRSNTLNRKELRDLERDCPDFPRQAWFDLSSATVHLSPDDSLDVPLQDYIDSENADPIDTTATDPPLELGEDNLRKTSISNLTAVGDGPPERRGNGFNLLYCMDVAPDGAAVGRPFVFNSAREPGSDSLEVERAGELFHVRTQPYPHNVGSCEHHRADGSAVVLLLHVDLAYDVKPE